jgi:hypothetical protein
VFVEDISTSSPSPKNDILTRRIYLYPDGQSIVTPEPVAMPTASSIWSLLQKRSELKVMKAVVPSDSKAQFHPVIPPAQTLCNAVFTLVPQLPLPS